MNEPEFIQYRFEIVGGPFDGSEGLGFALFPGADVPEVIHVGVCPGDGLCGFDRQCLSRARQHVAYWLEELEDVPIRTVRYEKEEEYTVRERGVVRGVARYAIGGLEMFGRLEELAEVPAGVSARSGTFRVLSVDPEWIRAVWDALERGDQYIQREGS